MSLSAADHPHTRAAADAAAAPLPGLSPQPGDGWRSNWIARHRIGVYVVLAFAFSWWPWPATVLNPESSPMVSFGPIVAAFVVAAAAGGRRRVVGLLRAAVRWRVPWSRYVIALAGPFLITGVTGVIAMAFEITQPLSLGDAYGWFTWSALPLLLLTTAVLGGPLFEEVGWRGFLLEELQRRHTVMASTVVVAIIWAGWHLPLLISEPTGQRPPLPFLVWVLAQAVLLTWIYNISSRSVLIAILFHAAVNVSGRLLLEPFVGQAGFVALWWLMAAAYALVAATLIWRTRGRLGRGTTTTNCAPAADRSDPS